MSQYDVTQRPETARKFTTAEVCAFAGITRPAVYNICSRYGIVYEVHKVQHGKQALFSYEDMRQIKDLVAKRYRPHQHESKAAPDKIEPETAHPLVTDKRCLNLNYWPDPTPAIFKGGDYDN